MQKELCEEARRVTTDVGMKPIDQETRLVGTANVYLIIIIIIIIIILATQRRLALCGLCLDDESIRVAVGLQLGTDVCVPHTCGCGTQEDSRGSHAFICKRAPGRIEFYFVGASLCFGVVD